MSDSRLYNVILAPLTTEKSTRIADKFNQFAFRVMRDATKLEIKQAVKKIFDIDCLKVRVVSMKGKKKRRGSTKAWKKAIVSLPAGKDIDLVNLD